MAAALAVAPQARGAAFTVNTTDDTISGVCDTIHCSLREAMIAANTSAGADVIGFSIFTGPQTIAITSLMPGLSGPTTVDGSTQPGYSGTPIIEVDGSGAGAFAPGLILGGGGLIRALVVNRFGGSGVRLDGNGTLEGSYIGTDITGTVDRGNERAGVDTAGSDNVIGGTAAGAGNLISGNDFSGIILNSSSNQVLGNVIGLNAAGTSAIGNCFGGIRVLNASNTIGGTAAGAGNVISGNQGCAVSGWAGVTLDEGSSGTTVQGNLIGTNTAGTALIPGGDIGVRIMGAVDNLIGGTAAGAGNVITSASASAIEIDDRPENLATGNRVEGNYIGTDFAGTADLGSAGPAVELRASDNTIGGTAANAGNFIVHNESDGVRVVSGTRNRIVRNVIHDNAALGINLGADGVTANDPGDGDGGPNDLQNYPTGLTATLVGGGQLEIVGTLDSAPGTYTLHFYAGATADPSGFGEGAGFLGSVTSGVGAFSYTFTPIVPVGGSDVVTATATSVGGSTSEFSAAVAVTDPSSSVARVGIEADPPCLNVLLTGCSFAPAQWIAATALAGAFRVRPDSSFEPVLVERVDVQAAPFVLTYHIKEEAVWSDGTPLTADDFEFTLDAILDPANSIASRAGYELVTQAEVIDDTTFRLSFSGRYPDWRSLFPVVLPKHVLAGHDFDEVWQDAIADPVTGEPIGSGPFLLTARTAGQSLTVSRNPRWWGPSTPALDSIVFRVVPNPNDQFEGIRDGSLDLIFPQPQVQIADIEQEAGIAVQSGPSTSMEHLDFNVQSAEMPLLRERWFRQAVAFSIDRPAAAATAYGDLIPGYPALHNLSFSSAQAEYVPVFSTYAYDPEAVSRLMLGHGCALGGDGIWSCSSTRASVRFATTQGNQLRELVQQSMITRARAAGIELVPDNSPSGTFFGERLPARQYELVMFTWVRGLLGDQRDLYGCAGAQNHMDYCSESVDQLLLDAAAEVDPVVRAGKVNSANRILADDVPTIPLFRRPTFLVQRETLQGPRVNPSGQATWNVETWNLGTTFVVNSAADPGDGTCDATCTLRDALDDANASASDDRIEFAIDSGPQTIDVTSALPLVTDPVVLDATTQPGYSGTPLIRLDGTEAGENTPGFDITAGGSTVRGFSITNFSWDGVKMRDGDGNTVEDNYLGVRLNGDGVAAAGNGTYGVLADFGSAGNVIRRNLIGANGFGPGRPYSGIGIWHAAADNVVEDNDVGVGPGLLGGETLPNAIGVIVAETTGAHLSGNTIAQNDGAGVVVLGAAAIGNRIVANSIYSNGGLGIDLGLDGVTANDAGDSDSGPNALQNFPVITGVSAAAGATTITGTIEGILGAFFDFELYRNDVCDDSGNGEGATYLGEGAAAVDGTSFSITFPGLSLATGAILTATATTFDNTSEFGPCFQASAPNTLVVNQTGDFGSGGCTASDCTLSEAIEAANAAPGRQTIEFEILPPDAFTISLNSRLVVTDPVTIDGTTQPGDSRTVVDGSGLALDPGDGIIEFRAGSDTSVIRGLAVSGSETNGIVLASDGNTVEDMYVGTNRFGSLAVANLTGILVTGSDNDIGDTTVAGRNVVSGNTASGIRVLGDRNAVRGNYVGLTADGAAALRNETVGIEVVGATENGIRRNVVSGSEELIRMTNATGTSVIDNLLGTDATGTSTTLALSPDFAGVTIDGGTANQIGNADLGNVIAGTDGLGIGGVGIRIRGSSGNVIERNHIGTDEAGVVDFGHHGAGVYLFDNSNDNRIRNNHFAFTRASEANQTGAGVVVASGVGNRISENRFRANVHAIDLGGDGPTPNDGGAANDADTGANDLLNFPVLEQASLDGETLMVAGSVDTNIYVNEPGLMIELFSRAAGADDQDAERFLGTVEVSTAGSGEDSFEVSLDGANVEVGDVIAATATDPAGNTSELSAGVVVAEPGGVTAAVTIAPQSGSETVTAPARVELEDVPAETFIAAARQAVEAAPLGSIPLGSIPLGSIPLGSIPLGSIGFLQPQIRTLLGGVALSTVPLTPPQSWEALLRNTTLAEVPLQSVSLQQALDALAGQPGGIQSVPLGSIGLQNSVLGSLTPEAVGLGVAPLGSIKIGDEGADEPGDTTLEDWCEWLSGPPVNCTNAASLQDESVLSSSLRGVPLGSIPLGSIPLGSIPLGSIPLGSIPLGSIDIEFSPLGSIPLGSIPLGSIPLGSIPLGSIPLGSINLQQSPLGSIPLGSIPLGSISTLFTCLPSCPAAGVLRDHLGQLRPNLTLEQLMRAVDATALGAVTFADVLLWVADSTLDGYTVRQLVETLLLIPDNELTFADLLAAFLAESALGWERLNLSAANVNEIAADVGTARYAVDVVLTPDTPAGLGAANSTAVAVTLPEGFAYVPGSSALDGDGSGPAPANPIANPAIAGRTLTWTLPLTVGPLHRLTFDANPRSTLGPAQATVEADAANAPPVAGLVPATVTVEDTFEANDDPAGPVAGVATSSFYLSYITGADDVDYFTYPVPSVAGTRVTFYLSHQPRDLDLVVYGPNGQVLRNERPGTEPLDGQPLDDDGPTLTSESDALEQQTLADLALANLPILGVSTLRGGEDDAVTVVSDGKPGDYVIQVTGFNGASSAEPYMLRPEQRAPAALPACQPRPFANGGTNATSLTRGTVPAAVDTVFVVNKAQWERVHGAVAVGAALGSLDGLMDDLADDGHPSAILQVDADADVQAAVATWNACPTELTRANAVMREIGLAIDAFRAAHVDAGSNSTVQNIVLLGGDEVIPAARLEDRTTVANEDGYAETFDTATELSTTLRLGYFLSDDPYGDVDPIPFFDRQLHIPDVPVGRLPTNPDAAVRAVDRFTDFDGRLAPATAVTTGYDFLKDGAEQVDAGLRAIDGVVGLNPPGLIGDAWNKAGLVGAFLPGGVAPDLSSINGHADHRGLQPAAGAELFEVGNLPPVTGGANEAFDGKLVFSMGCHAGLSVSDVFVVSPLGTADWPQAYTQRGGIYAASSGFAYGDGKLVAYSEDLHRRFAENLGGFAAPGDLTIGAAVVLAKQDYFGELGLVGVYDEKAASEFTLYGLPMWKVGGPAAAAAPAVAASEPAAAAVDDAVAIQSAPTHQELVVEPATGLTAEQLTTDWTPPPASPGPGGQYVVGQDGVQVTHFRPVEPKTVLPVTVPSAHGALITELSSTSSTPFDPYFARPIVDSTVLEPVLDWDRLVHPAKLQTVTTSKLGTTKRHRLVLATGQFTGLPGGGETGTQRLFPHVQALVFSAPSNDYAKPILGRVVATGIGASVAFSVETHDQAPNGANDVARVRVGYLDQPDGGTTRVWKFLDLVRTPSTDRWSGAGPLVSATAQFLYFVQAVDRAGNVAVSTNKGLYYEEATTAPPVSGGLSIEAPAPPPSGWFGGNVPVTLLLDGEPATGDDDLEVDVDGKGFEPYGGPVTVTGDGPHTVTAKAPDGREVAITVLIDTGPPQIVIASPVQGAQIGQGQPLTADYSCLDAGAGVEPSACVGPVADGATIDTSTPGPKTFTVTAQDRLGKSASKTVSYTVARRSIVFASSRTGSGDIYAVGEGGGAVVRLTAHSAIDAEPARSADGSKIAFTSTRNGNIELYSMNADGSNVQRLTTNSAVDLSPVWSPDGTKIAFSSNRNGDQFDVFVMNADGTGVRRLTTHSGADLTPDWSPDGQKIAFSSTRTGGADIYVMNANNGSAQMRLTTVAAIDVEPNWSPDGAKIAFSTNRHGILNFEIYAMNANGSSQTRLTNHSAVDITPSWSPDGAKFVFSTRRDGNFELYAMNANGSSPTRVTNHPGIDATPDW